MADAERRTRKKRAVEQYEFADATRKNNPPVGLVTSRTDRDAGRKRYAYDPHIDPALQFDSQGAEVEDLIDAGLAAEELDDAKAALEERATPLRSSRPRPRSAGTSLSLPTSRTT